MPDMLPNSPFQKVDMQPIEEGYETKGKVPGLRRKDGSILLNFNTSTSHDFLKRIAKITDCELVWVSGTWTFTPDRDNEDSI